VTLGRTREWSEGWSGAPTGIPLWARIPRWNPDSLRFDLESELLIPAWTQAQSIRWIRPRALRSHRKRPSASSC